MALRIAVRLIFLIFMLGSFSSMSYIHNNIACDDGGTITNNIQRQRRGIVKQVVSGFRQWIRVKRAKKIMLIGATLLLKTDDAVFYAKPGGKIRAERDFWMIDVYDIKKGFSLQYTCEWKCGTVGDNTVSFVDKFSDSSPFPAIFLYKKVSLKTVTIVLYK